MANTDTIKGNWKQLQGEAKRNWGELSDDDVMRAEGDRDKMIGIIQERYGVVREEAERQWDEWSRKHL